MSIQDLRNTILAGEYDRAQTLINTLQTGGNSGYFPLWYQGLNYLLQGEEEEAQGVWFAALMELPEAETESATAELGEVLADAAQVKTVTQAFQEAWVIRQYLAELIPDYFNNLFSLLELDDRLGLVESLEAHAQAILADLEENSRLNATPVSLASSLVIFEAYESLQILLDGQSYLAYLETIATGKPTERQILKQALFHFLNRSWGSPDRCLEIADFLESFATLSVEEAENEGCDFEILSFLITYFIKLEQYDRAIDLADQFIASANLLEDKIAGYYFLIQALMKAGAYFHRVEIAHQAFLNYLAQVLEKEPITDENLKQNLIILSTFLGYLADNPRLNNHWKQTIARCYVQGVQTDFSPDRLERYQPESFEPSLPEIEEKSLESGVDNENSSKIRIGYISECLRRHSIGYLVRDVFQYHDRSRFEVFAYTFEYTDDLIQKEILDQGQKIKIIENTDPAFIYHLIQNDRLDILIDLDSLTSKMICRVLALKVAPIQVSWLGYDAAELPTIDYFLADPYVLPEAAQSYYQEKIWRLPQTYIAVNGFEVGVPSLRREMLNIPPKAIVYLSAQTGYKRNPNNIRSQLEILKAVPDSYFLIKGFYSDLEALQLFFQDLADQVGVHSDRLRFLETVQTEETHRANLGLADIILDTYPYNGTTTTLEALWMGIPVVTRVGQQFSARTGYGALMNVGITSGLAWTAEDYVSWGVRLGKDAALRQRVSLQLQQSQQQAPLWQAKSFTLQLENAYRSMIRIAHDVRLGNF